MGQIINTQPGEIHGVDASINLIITKALMKDRSQRFQTVREMISSLEQMIIMEKRKRVKARTFIDKTITSQIKDVRKQLRKIEEMKQQINTHLEEASLALKQGRFETAITSAKEVLKLDNAHQKAEKILEHATKYMELKQEEEKHKMKWIREKLVEAQENMQTNHYIKACEVCESIIKVDPDNNDARVMKAVSIKKIKDFLDKVEQTDHS
jgi:tetratricopeptide (TPR) repeat protein